MEILFKTGEKDIKKLAEVLSEDEVNGCCTSKVYYQGVDYLERECVSDVKSNSGINVITATVRASDIYYVQLKLKNMSLQADCTCPRNGVCKHIVATLLYIISRPIDASPANTKFDQNIHNYLQSLTKEDLVDLVLKYAPEDFFNKIANKHSGNSNALKTLQQVKSKLEVVFNNEQMMHEPYALEEALLTALKKLSGLEKKFPEKMGELIFYIQEQVEKSMDKGYLYDQYRDYSFEPTEEFYEFIVEVARSMDFTSKTEFLRELDATVSNSSYSTFHGIYQWLGKCFDDADLPELRTLLINEFDSLPHGLVAGFYSRVSSLLTNNEKEKVLTLLIDTDPQWAEELAELLNALGKRKKSILMLRQLILGNRNMFTDERLFFLYLDQMKEEKLDLREESLKCIKRNPTAGMLRKIIELLPSVSEACEDILEKQSPNELLGYLESLGRIADGFSLINRNKNILPDQIFRFYKKNKKTFPEEAGKYFTKLIHQNLRNTGDHYYILIADALKHLTVIDKESASEMILYLRQNYKRRTKLMDFISTI